MTARFTEPPRRAADVDVCVVGNLTIDVILRGITEMPAWGREVLCDTRTDVVAGQAAAMALACVRLGLRAQIIADVGEDDAGERVVRELAAARVGVESVSTVAGGVTPMTVALVRPDGERAFLSDLGRLGPLDVSSWPQRWPRAFAASVVALVGTSNLPGLDLAEAAAMFQRVRRDGALTVFDPGWDPGDWSADTVEAIGAVLAETDLFLPNLDEARALTGTAAIGEVLASLASICPGVIVVKGGSDGSYVRVDDRVAVVEAVPATVDNAVGAGDVFDAGMVAGYLRGADVRSSMALATAAASLYVSRRVDRFPTYDETAELAEHVTTAFIE